MNIKYVVFITLGFIMIVGFMNLNSKKKDSTTPTQTTKQAQISEDQTIYTIPEEPAVPIGGLQTLYKHIEANLKYPEMARRRGIEGRVFVEFVVEKDGKVSQLNIVKGIDKACDQEALRLLRSFVKWNPGKHNGKVVRVKRSFPVLFKL